MDKKSVESNIEQFQIEVRAVSRGLSALWLDLDDTGKISAETVLDVTIRMEKLQKSLELMKMQLQEVSK